MNIKTTRFGEIEVNDELVLNFVSPIIGYDNYQKYVLIDYDEKSCFKWLQSVDNPELAFPVTSTTFFDVDYNFEVPDDAADLIGVEKVEQLLVLNIASIPANNPKATTVNLRAPVIINNESYKAMQLVLQDDSLKIRFPLFNSITPSSEKKEG